MARPQAKVDGKLVLDLASIFCTMEEIATIAGCSVNTLERRFGDVIKKGRETAKSSLRRSQWALAQSGNPTMNIWLGKQYLGQKDQSENSLNDDQLNRLLAVANASMVQDSGAGRTASGHK